MSLRDELIQVAAVAVRAVQDIDYGHTFGTRTREAVLSDVTDERIKQEIKWGSVHHTPEEWLAILAEEVGEAAREVPTTSFGSPALMLDYLRRAEGLARAFLKERFGPNPEHAESGPDCWCGDKASFHFISKGRVDRT